MSKTVDTFKLTSSAMIFVIIVSIADFFADLTYEGSRSITGPFLGSLGATATIIGAASGFGEMVGYVLRSASGILVNKSRRYWLFAILGYTINMLAVPAMALAGNWPLAVAMIIIERAGRAIRKPAMETMISYTTGTLGRGWVFGLNTALDQAGATLGPLVVALVFLVRHDYRICFATLLISAVCCLLTIVICSFLYPKPSDFAGEEKAVEEAKPFSKEFWLYVGAATLVGAGFADFALVAFHFQKTALFSAYSVPLLYGLAMGMGAISALLFGKLLDKIGFAVILIAVSLAAFFAPLAFSNSMILAVIGSALWGVGKGAQDSILKAELIRLVPMSGRSSAFGVYSSIFGIGWFLGSAALGWLYDHSIPIMIAVSVVIQLLSLPLFWMANRKATPYNSIKR